jgi:hypothetical protein
MHPPTVALSRGNDALTRPRRRATRFPDVRNLESCPVHLLVTVDPGLPGLVSVPPVPPQQPGFPLGTLGSNAAVPCVNDEFSP